MFGFRKTNSVITSLSHHASKKRKSQEDMKEELVVKHTNDVSADVSKKNGSQTVSICHNNDECYSTPLGYKSSNKHFSEEFSTPSIKSPCADKVEDLFDDDFPLNEVFTTDIPQTNTNGIIHSTSFPFFPEPVEHAASDHVETNSNALSAYNDEFYQINLRIKRSDAHVTLETIAKMYDTLDFLVARISEQIATLQDNYLKELEKKVSVNNQLKIQAGTFHVYFVEELEQSLGTLFSMMKDVYSKMRA